MAKKLQLGSEFKNLIKESLRINYILVQNLDLGSGAEYQLSLPNGCFMVEPLFKTDGSDYSGGSFIIPGGTYTYLTNTSSTGTFRGVYVVCSYSGKITISTYQHCGSKIKGFKMWYLGTN